MRRISRSGIGTTAGFGLSAFSRDELDSIHYATLQILQNTGVKVLSEQALEVFHGSGCEVERFEGYGIVKIPSYVGSKFAVLGGLSCVQCAMLLAIVYWGAGLQGPWKEMFVSLLLTSLVGVAIGLTVSALARTSEVAIALLPLILLPMVMLAGVMQPVHKMSFPVRALAQVIPSRCRPDLHMQVVEHQWIRIGCGEIGEHHVRLVQFQCLDVGQSHALGRYAHFPEGEIFCDCKVLTIPAIGRQHLHGGRPVILGPPVVDIINKREFIEEVIGDPEFFHLVLMLVCRNQRIPVGNASSGIIPVFLLDPGQYLLRQGELTGMRDGQADQADQGCEQQQ